MSDTKEKWDEIQRISTEIMDNYEPGYVNTYLAIQLAELCLELDNDLVAMDL